MITIKHKDLPLLDNRVGRIVAASGEQRIQKVARHVGQVTEGDPLQDAQRNVVEVILSK